HFLPAASPEVKKFPKEEEAHHAGKAVCKRREWRQKASVKVNFSTDQTLMLFLENNVDMHIINYRIYHLSSIKLPKCTNFVKKSPNPKAQPYLK
ncbi:MAG: hypothetical protein ACK56F_18180, partial [bacterium]